VSTNIFLTKLSHHVNKCNNLRSSFCIEKALAGKLFLNCEGGATVEITIKGEPKEIAALVLAIQEQPDKEKIEECFKLVDVFSSLSRQAIPFAGVAAQE